MKQLFNKKNRIILSTTFIFDYIFNVVLTTTFEPNLLTRFVLSSIFVLSVLVLSSKLYDKYTQPKTQIL
jgi:hypothetical protein